MPKRQDIHKILIIGSGPIVIGQAAEFDYAGTQAILALKEEGYEVILCNSNPATIMTDTKLADKVYMEPLTLEYVAKILRYERPDAIIPSLGGQTGLNLAMELERKGVLRECNVELLGTPSSSINRAEDRDEFKALCAEIGEPTIPSRIAHSQEEALEAAEEIGYPVVLRPAFTLGGTGGGFAHNREELLAISKNALYLSPVQEVLIEESIKGYKEIEFEVMRDEDDDIITICAMENLDPVGVHTGDSIVVSPCQSLTPDQYDLLNKSAHRLIQALEIAGGCNVQFALNPEEGSDQYYLIEVNPRVSRSSALASKATGYPIARVTTKVACGMRLWEIPLAGGNASMEPQLDYTITKFPRFPFDKFPEIPNTLSTQMKATGEVMGIGANLSESLLKAVRSLETGVDHLYLEKFDSYSDDDLISYLKDFHADGIFGVTECLRRGMDLDDLYELTKISPVFLQCIKEIVAMEEKLDQNVKDLDVLKEAKAMGFSDPEIGRHWDMGARAVYHFRRSHGIVPNFRTVNPFQGSTTIPYYYSSYNGENEEVLPGEDDKKVVVLGAGPIRIGQGVEFDYSTVHAVYSLQKEGYEAIIINNNPETVSTDYSTADKLYFEPLTPEDVMAVMNRENPAGAFAFLGGQTAINLAHPLQEEGIRLLGTDAETIDRAENRNQFNQLVQDLGIPQPEGKAVSKLEEGVKAAKEIGYPVLVRPSFVLGGRAMQIVANEHQLRYYLEETPEISEEKPVLIDKYIQGKEVEVDGVCDGHDIFIPGIMELVERSGVHSGDSISCYPTISISDQAKGTILRYSKKLVTAIGIVGLFNIQWIVTPDNKVYIIEINPRASRTVPFLSKVTGFSLADIATEAALGISLPEQGIFTTYPKEANRYYVKFPVFSFNKIRGVDAYLSPEMKSTGEVIGYDDKLNRALYKGLQASGMKVRNYGTVFATIDDDDKQEALPLIRHFYELGFNIEATEGTANFLKSRGIRTHILHKISEGSKDIPQAIHQGHIAYVINTANPGTLDQENDGRAIRKLAAETSTTLFTSLDTVRVLLDVLEETTLTTSTIDAPAREAKAKSKLSH